ncbi:sensor histidine kinase [Plantactinospora solaniradicis]|uniref:histidine kinase n=1 Tax=Plantactinospora solaniradicis TaxID=1723736 RepID=A0ABW1KIW6_9ACTN
MRRPAGWHFFVHSGRSYLLSALLAVVLLAAAAYLPPSGGTTVGRSGENVDMVRYWWLFAVPLFVALFLQHRWPLPALALAVVGAAGHLYYARLEVVSLVDLVVAITLYTVANRARARWTTVAVTGALLAGVVVTNFFVLLSARAGGLEGGQRSAVLVNTVGKERNRKPVLGLLAGAAGNGMGMMLVLASAAALGEGARARRKYHEIAEQRAADLERDRGRQVELATVAERARISRELHDVVAHSLTVMVAQAQAASATQHRRPELSTEAMDDVVTTGRAALAEMRRLLGTVAGPSDGQGPGLDGLSELLDRVRAAGTPVRLGIDGQLVPLPPAVDLTAYRIVQEALTNTIKHARPGARAEVRLAFAAHRVDVEVTDDGAGLLVTPTPSRGNGLRGITERVALLGGQVAVGPRPDAGFGVRASLRLDQPAVGA